MNHTLSTTYLESVADCDGCGHCGDLSRPAARDPASLTQQRTDLSKALTTWLTAAAAAKAAPVRAAVA